MFAPVILVIESHRTVRWELSAGSMSQSDESAEGSGLLFLPVCQTALTECCNPPPASDERSHTTHGPEPGGGDACRSISGVGPCRVGAHCGATTQSGPAQAVPGSEIESWRQPDSCPEGDFIASSNGLEV
jgi:hypothetical protein